MQKWEYKIKALSVYGKAMTFLKVENEEVEGFLGGTKVKKKSSSLSAEEMEDDFNNLGQDGWELCGIVPLVKAEIANPGGSNTARAYFIFKRQAKQ